MVKTPLVTLLSGRSLAAVSYFKTLQKMSDPQQYIYMHMYEGTGLSRFLFWILFLLSLFVHLCHLLSIYYCPRKTSRR